MSEALKPCPFCGGEDLTEYDGYVTCDTCDTDGPLCDTRDEAIEKWNTRATLEQPSTAEAQPRLTVRLLSFPESNGKRNWTAMIARVDKWGGLIGNCGGITVARGEFWNRVAYEAECTKLLIGERTTQPDILDYSDDIETPEEWKGEIRGGHEVAEAKRIKEEAKC